MFTINTQNHSESIVIVGGCGHVGLPLGLKFAESGFKVTAFDTSKEKVEIVNAGLMPFIEDGAQEILGKVLANKTFKASTDPSSIRGASVVMVVIGTPVDEHLSPNPNSVVEALENLFEYLDSSQLVLLRSTVFPGVSRKVLSVLQRQFPDIKVAYCPERIAEGFAISELATLPQIIGTNDASTFSQASEIFKRITSETLSTTYEEAELAKLFTNVWRYIKFAAANQFFMMANDFNVDYERVRSAISFNYPRANDLPSAGFAAGPCLFKDTMQLSALVQQNFALGNAAMMINEGTPGYIVQRLERLFELPSLTVGILGLSFKGGVDDTRSSLAYKLRKLLMFKCKDVLLHDPLVSDSRISNLEEVIKKSDVLIIGSPHQIYATIQTEKPVIDIWNIRGLGVRI
jgi:UDP-N-acetyl-D-mannosaminuronic acid dehydrogenase